MNILDAAYIPIALATAPWWAFKKRGGWAERLGAVEPLPEGASTRAGVPRIVLHAVSVGEVNALRGVVPHLTAHARVIVSSTTDTGIERARALFGGTCDVVRYPLDASFAVRRFLDVVRPDGVALVELELWPNFLHLCARRNIPVCVINGRLSERSFRGYQRIRRLVSGMFASLAFASVQDEEYGARFHAMGVAPGDCLVLGSVKWDVASLDAPDEAPALCEDMGIDPQRPLIVAGSTGPGEEALLHHACPAGVQLLCAPRKPDRFDEAARALPGCIRRSEGRAGRGADRFLLDTIGELRAAYALADIVVIGRSFGDLYGSDPIEAAALGKPVVIGPRIGDFARIVDAFVQADAIVRTTRDELGSVLGELADDAQRQHDLGTRARACVVAHQGASERTAALILEMVRGACDQGDAPGGPGVLRSWSATAGV